MTSKRIAAFLAASVFFGGTFVGAKYGLRYFPPLLFVSFRFDVAAVALAAYVLVFRPATDLLPRTGSDVAAILAAGGFSIALTNSFLFVGQQYASSATGAVVFSLNPLLTPVFAAALLADERLSGRAATGMTVGLLGVVLVVHPTPTSILAGGPGKLLLLGAAASAALGSVLIRRADADLDSTIRTAWALPVGALLSHGIAYARGEHLGAVTWTPTAGVSLLYVGLLSGAAGLIAYFGLLDSVGPNRANLVYYVVPIVSTVGGAVVLGESITPLTIAGFLVVFAGFAVIGTENVDLREHLPDLGDSTAHAGTGERRTGLDAD